MKLSRIYLCGMMGVGKTTIGKKLAALLNFTFVDLDQEIEKKEGRLIKEIFDAVGEEGFREVEASTLRGLTASHIVVATGGGTPCFHNNMEHINSQGTSIYLRANDGLIFQRISRYPNKRPMLKGLNNEQIRAFIQQKLREREPFYKQSHHVFDVPAVSAESIVESSIFTS